MEEIIGYGTPFWEETTPPPPLNAEIKNYITSLLLYSTKSSIRYLCLDNEDKEVKVIKFIKVVEEKIPRIKDEIETLRIVQHPNIIKVQDIFRYDAYICVVFPYTPHLSLHQYLMNEYPIGFPEELAASIFRQMLKAVEYLHSLNIWHRDIKLESFLVFDSEDQTDPNNRLKIVLSNFEYAKLFEEGVKETQFIGTPEFMAPEMVNHVPYNQTVDIWSLGISLFVMLTGQFPLPSYKTSPKQCLSDISKGLLNNQILTDKEISHAAISLITNMCELDPNQRVSASTALLSTWLSDNNVYKNTAEAEKESKIADEFFNINT